MPITVLTERFVRVALACGSLLVAACLEFPARKAMKDTDGGKPGDASQEAGPNMDGGCADEPKAPGCKCGPNTVRMGAQCVPQEVCAEAGCELPPDSGEPEPSGRIIEDGGVPPEPGVTSAEIAEVRAAIHAAAAWPVELDARIGQALVTFIKPSFGGVPVGAADGAGFFIQSDDFGPALFIAVDPTTIVPDGIRVGDLLELVVTQGSVTGSLVFASAASARLIGENAPLPTVQLMNDLEVAPIATADWDLESELVTCVATVAGAFTPAGAGFSGVSITTTAEPDVTQGLVLRIPNDLVAASGIAPGCTVTVARTPMSRFASRPQLPVWNLSDLTLSCPPLEITSTYPADQGVDITPLAAIKLTFNQPLPASALVAQTVTGQCTGNVQLSADGFTTCVAFATESPAWASSGTVASLNPAAVLSPDTDYVLRVLAGVLAASGNSLNADKAVTFRTGAKPASCDGRVVLSQVYGGGGNSGATFANDFVELHNNGASAVSITGWSLQYASGTGLTWTVFPLPDVSIPGGAYYLVQLQAGGFPATPLPEPDASGPLTMGGTQGKVALSSTTAALPGTLPTGAPLVDLVAYGMAAPAEGMPTPLLSSTGAAVRAGAGCIDTNDNFGDFSVQVPAPRNSKTSPLVCACAQ